MIRPLHNDTKVIIQTLLQTDVGGICTYDTLSKAIGLDISLRKGCLSTALRRARLDDGAVFAAVPTVGYKRLPDNEIVSTVKKRIATLRRASAREVSKLACVKDFDSLPKQTQIEHNVCMSLYSAIGHATQARTVEKVRTLVTSQCRCLPVAATLEALKK